MEGGQQLRLLLWKDYLIRKRKLITLVGIIWAMMVMSSLYIVRINVDNVDHPTCSFPARALPSAGMLRFLQSFMCTINNECSPLDQYDEIPAYENSKLTKLQRTLAPVLNDTVLDVASSVPDAIKLLATLADVVDDPAFKEISNNGLKIKDLFEKPSRVRRYVSEKLHISDDVTRSIMDAELSLQDNEREHRQMQHDVSRGDDCHRKPRTLDHIEGEIVLDVNGGSTDDIYGCSVSSKL